MWLLFELGLFLAKILLKDKKEDLVAEHSEH
jgi:Sec-independent protein secretion pathway component TatC